ncbi:MAG TPA: carbamoyltransferase C-terminal domain-containing protein [Gammaproteobacteria bacterium]|nr:carbamoyltransferase C-terminal domain-containing protein [Gammaproteobacteria bacterium]
MQDAPTILGINRTQDASITVMRGSQLVCSMQKERLTRRKHHWGKLDDVKSVYAEHLRCLDEPIDALVECFSSDRELENLPAYERELAETLRFAPGCRRARISHHLAHLYSVFHPSPFEEAAVMIVDGQGSPVRDLTESWSGASELPAHWREVSSFYRVDRERIDCLGKQLWDCDDARLVGLGMFYFLLTQAIFPGEGNEGKVMGLAPHGNPDALDLPPLEVDGATVTIPMEWREIVRERERFRYSGGGGSGDGLSGSGLSHSGLSGGGRTGRFRDTANLAAAGQRAFEEALLEVARWLHAETQADDLCFAGGTALNCCANDRLLRETPFRRVFIPPAPSDAGTSLGCAVYGLTAVLGQPCGYRWEHDFLGPERPAGEIESALRAADDLVVERPSDLAGRMAELLAATKIVALYQGRSEFGPRALGHRSILGDPRFPFVRDFLNSKIKGREWFRPLAPIVLLEHADELFDIRRPSPFMQFAAPVLPEATERIPAVTHVDGTARLQTVGKRDDALLRAVLERFAERTGIPVLLNTSFNGKDEPIVETPAEALASFRSTPMHALAMPPYLVTKRVEPERPA